MPKFYVNEDKTIGVSIWSDGTVSLATRKDSDQVWGPPIKLTEVSQ